MDRYISGDAEQSFSYFTGLKRSNFPPSEQLELSDIKKVLQAFNQILKTWNASIDYPEKMPVKARYDFMLTQVLEDGFTPVDSGVIHFDFCTGYAPDCVWGDYCSCLQFWEDDT